MEIYRIMGALLISLSGALGAYSLNAASKRSLRRTESILRLLRHIRSQIDCFSMSIPKALERCPDDILRGCGFCADRSPSSVLEIAEASESLGARGADAEADDILGGFAREIGRGYRDDQLALCDRCILSLEEILKKQTDELPSRKKRNGALCLCGALAVVILLI